MSYRQIVPEASPRQNASRRLPAGYRERLYQYYTNARPVSLAPATTAGLEPRAKYAQWLVTRFFPAAKDAEILELGCGYGALLHFARKNGYRRLEGIDRSPQQVAAARRLEIGGVREGDLMAVLQETPAASKDAVIAFDVIEHFKRDELVTLVDEVYRVLKPGGRWIIHVPNGGSPFCGRIRYGDMTHELAFTQVSIAQLLQASGFSKVECFEDKPMGRNRLIGLCRKALWMAIRGVLLTYIAAESGTFDRSAIFSQNFLAVATRES